MRTLLYPPPQKKNANPVLVIKALVFSPAGQDQNAPVRPDTPLSLFILISIDIHIYLYIYMMHYMRARVSGSGFGISGSCIPGIVVLLVAARRVDPKYPRAP